MTSFHPQNIDREEPTQAVPVKQQLILVGAILFLLLGGVATSRIAAAIRPPTESAPDATKQKAEQVAKTTADPFADMSLTAKAVFVYDVAQDEVLYSQNSDEKLPLASVTKLMTALVAHELLSEGSTVQIDETALRQDGYSNLLLDERFTRQSLSDLTLTASTNDGAYALAAAAGATLNESNAASAFVKAMNIRAEELGLTKMSFKNPSGLDISDSEAGGYGSARDVSLLMAYLVQEYPELLEYTTELSADFTSEDGYIHEGINTNYYVDEIPDLIGSKTGYTNLAGGNLVVAFNAGLNRPVVVTVLGSTRHDRFTDTLKLINAAMEDINSES